MSDLFTGILNGAPLWVWPLLVGLIALGLITARTRWTSLVPFYFLPLLALISLQGILALDPQILVWPIYGIGYSIGAYWVYRRQAGLILERAEGRVRLQGEWLPMISLMVIFWANFANGTISAISPSAAQGVPFVVVFVAIVSLVSGSFLGRSVRILRG
ncbi:hypothetical protein GCM10007939_01760 [Amylibacter marinus]|uniref:Uncharacterized protein n=1 Tax=Amylibacter marinus TaxID=1475483 RepID=A0ABQ5VR53_9RHOB|nr:hypothetical protein [Amylibacter marinus]GLQ33893.1 hypothetical protein GCM10007939_01760 [Amylibacter marinus]